ncbi:MAG TPA: hypothetical protein QF611_13420 [Pseudomonadales bacterium]|jgi:hypothetical protein|nr:hypothetical protein [Arenicellales bacterium]HJP52023.1 hypothetical protein [Pseudomonadales bacterium]|tara:strand:- start:5395 stop:6369 length:975 start_codon:yes stop_codon:yes gene_type:complete
MRLITFIFPLCALALSATADEYIEWVGANSGVNWSSGNIQAEGAGVGPDSMPPSMARMMACRAAVVDAQRNLLESIQGVRVAGNTVVANMMVESDVIKTSVSGLLQGAQVVKRDPQSDGSCLVQMTAPLGGKFTTDVYQQVFDNAPVTSLESKLTPFTAIAAFVDRSLEFLIPKTFAAETPSWQQGLDRLSARISALEDLLSTHPAVVEVKDTGPTGLVLDARGSNFIPSMSPKILKLRAGVIYPNKKHQMSRRERGQLVSLFTRDLNTARRHPIVGERPIVLKALRTFGKTRTQIVLGTQSSDRLLGLLKEGFLDDSGVIIVL